MAILEILGLTAVGQQFGRGEARERGRRGGAEGGGNFGNFGADEARGKCWT